MILALDPSSVTIGYALMSGPNVLREGGKLNPQKTRLASLIRIEQLAADLVALIKDSKPETIVIEITSGKVAKRHGSGGGAGLGVYGMAVGYFLRTCQERLPARWVVAVEENTWTEGVPKKKRTQAIASIFRNYKPETDVGGDVADAIGLGRWWLQGQAWAKKVKENRS